MTAPQGRGPDLALVGAARSGTSTLASELSAHPDVDAGKVKESNYYSRHLDRGPQWYESLYQSPRPGLLRLDASTSYTYPQFPDALAQMADASNDVFTVYVVRHPVQRAVSHYLFYRYYFQREQAKTFGEALRTDSYYTDVSDYDHWLSELQSTFAKERLLVVPFEAVTRTSHEVASVICRQVGLPEPSVAGKNVAAHRNDVVAYRAESIRLAARTLRRSSLYPRVRSALGAHRMKWMRTFLTRQPAMPSAEEALASCDEAQLEALSDLEARAGAAVRELLVEQDERCGLSWSSLSFAAAGSAGG